MPATSRRTIRNLIALMCTLFIAAPLAAEIVQYDEGTRYDIEKIQHVATGADMVGMKVTASFSDNSEDEVTWTATGVESGRAFGTGWLLTVSGDTWYNHDWCLQNTLRSAEDKDGDGENDPIYMTKILLDGGVYDPEAEPIVRDTIFDIYWGGDADPGTEGSEKGKTFVVTGGTTNILVTYRDYVALEGQDPIAVGEDPISDVWRYLEIDFLCTDGYWGNTFKFQADTDVLPVPGSVVLGLMGLGLAGWIKRRMA